MLRRLRAILIVLAAAVLGAALGRAAFEARERMQAGEDVTALDLEHVKPRIQDVIPGLVAAFRVKDAPWSWFHIPSWLAAFAVNLALAAVGGDIASIRERAERMAFEFAGLDARDFGLGGMDEREDRGSPGTTPGSSAQWSAPPPPPPPPPPPGSPGSAADD
jgi:hypothetical protein